MVFGSSVPPKWAQVNGQNPYEIVEVGQGHNLYRSGPLAYTFLFVSVSAFFKGSKTYVFLWLLLFFVFSDKKKFIKQNCFSFFAAPSSPKFSLTTIKIGIGFK